MISHKSFADVSSGKTGVHPSLAQAEDKAKERTVQWNIRLFIVRPRSMGSPSFTERPDRKTRPALLLLHGLPSSSRMFEPLFVLLSDRYHLVAPDYPGLRAQRLAGPEKIRLHVRSLRRDHD
jgi:pimeloyl-ACP methyl ester carboxylesterase